MFKVYKYLYYRVYTWNLKTWGKKDVPEWNALYGVSFIMFLNINLLIFIISLFIDLHIFPIESVPKKEVLTIAILLLILNYFSFVRNEKYKLIVEEFKNEPPHKRRRNTFLLFLFVVLSFVLPYLVIHLFYMV